MVQFLSMEGEVRVPAQWAEYGEYLKNLTEADYLKFYRDMARIRRFDNEATALQRQGQLGLWVPAIGQEGAQIGSGYGVGPNDHIFPSYREHGVALTHGIDLMSILKMLRGVNHGGWNPDETRFHLYAIVLGTQVLHATGYAMGVKFDGKVGTGNKDEDLAVISYMGDGATAEGDVSEAFLFAAVNESPIVFFVQNNQWAISSRSSAQTKVPLYQRGDGFGVPGIRIDGNDVLASYAVTAKHMDDARAGLPENAAEIATAAAEKLADVSDAEFKTENIQALLNALLIEQMELKPRVAFGPLRTAISGRRISPPLFESMQILGKTETIARLKGFAASA